ncbi:hypothetical protein [Methylogaea oryzae]|uniref:hypothetical protein n=1 Tax=Methylogaea oryzae TaxID=1295382 RepID=UPI0006CF7792|nr:hypothetical protein [Methylogaea oryzae]
MNFYAGQGSSNTTLDYGLPWGVNAGFSVLNAGFYSAAPATLWIEPDALFNLEKHWGLADGWELIAGTQTGAAFHHTGLTRLLDFTYVDSQWVHPSWGTELHLGGYYANAAMAGRRRDAFGWHANLEVPLIADRLVLEGDYLSGRNNVGGSTVKLSYSPTRHWTMSFGVQVPAARSGNDYSGLFGVYWNN